MCRPIAPQLSPLGDRPFGYVCYVLLSGPMGADPVLVAKSCGEAKLTFQAHQPGLKGGNMPRRLFH
jgi:hypothetical protein